MGNREKGLQSALHMKLRSCCNFPTFALVKPFHKAVVFKEPIELLLVDGRGLGEFFKEAV